MRRGEVWWVDFGIPFGSEPGYRRLQEKAGRLPRALMSTLDEGLKVVLGIG